MDADLSLLGLSPAWLDAGMDPDDVRRAANELRTGEDPHAEHHRWGLVVRFLQAHRPLSAELARIVFDLAGADRHLCGSIRGALVALPECPPDVDALAVASGAAHLVRAVERRRLFAALEARGWRPDAALVDRMLASGLRDVQTAALERATFDRASLQRFADAGATRAVRNVAKSLLRRRSADVEPDR